MRSKRFSESNYKSIFFNNKTLRFRIDQAQQISELKWPEFYDIKITNQCYGGCNECYQNSTPSDGHADNLIANFDRYFGPITENQKPYQIAIGGGEPTLHPDFFELLKVSHAHGIVPNYTTNGTWSNTAGYARGKGGHSSDWVKKLLDITKLYCGGVAVSVHPHLNNEWRKAAWLFMRRGIRTNLHVIISDEKSIDDFVGIFKRYIELEKQDGYGIDYFVLLPYEVMGRAKPKEIYHDHLFMTIKSLKDQGYDIGKISYGANFYKVLKQHSNWLDISLYEPHHFSAYLDMTNMKLYKSSFNLKEVRMG